MSAIGPKRTFAAMPVFIHRPLDMLADGFRHMFPILYFPYQRLEAVGDLKNPISQNQQTERTG